MALIPWIINQTIVETDEDFKSIRKGVLVRQLDPNQLQEINIGTRTNACYDLRVGENYRRYRDAHPLPLSEGEYIRLPSGEGAVIDTVESVHLSDLVFGLILPKESLLRRGISNTPTKVDPGFSGPLHVTVFNHGKQEEKLGYNDQFCALCLFEVVEDGIVPYRKASRPIRGVTKQPRGTRMRNWLEVNQIFWRIIPIILSIIFSITALVIAVLSS